jgi:hypothetical protein
LSKLKATKKYSGSATASLACHHKNLHKIATCYFKINKVRDIITNKKVQTLSGVTLDKGGYIFLSFLGGCLKALKPEKNSFLLALTRWDHPFRLKTVTYFNIPVPDSVKRAKQSIY